MTQVAEAQPNAVSGWLAESGYLPPADPTLVKLDIVTPTHNRRRELIEQAKLIGPQLGPNDRWIIVDDASELQQMIDPRELIQFVPREKIMLVYLTYAREQDGTVNQARHAGCSLARPDAWIVEIDDHDFVINADAMELVRNAICRGAMLVYGDVVVESHDGAATNVFEKPDYTPWLLRDGMCPCEGVRAFPKFLYDAVGGYRWCGPRDVGANEFPAGDYGLYLRIEQLCDGQGFHRIPAVLNRQPKVVGGISTRFMSQQADMAAKLRMAAQQGVLMER